MQEEHHSGLCPALCLKFRHEYVRTSRGHDRKRSAIAERSTPDCAGAEACETRLILSCEPVFELQSQWMTLFNCTGKSAMQAVSAFFGGRLAGTVYARILPEHCTDGPSPH